MSSSTGVMVNVGCVPTQSGSKSHSVTVHCTDVGRFASSTCTRRGVGALMTNSSSPPVSPDPAAEVHQAVRPDAVVIASNTASGVACTRIVFS